MKGKELMEKNMVTEELIVGNLLSSIFETTTALPLNEPLELQLGYGLLFLVDKGKKSVFLQKIAKTRKLFSFPIIHIIDMPTINYYEYRITSFGEEVKKGLVTKENAIETIIQSISNFFNYKLKKQIYEYYNIDKNISQLADKFKMTIPQIELILKEYSNG